MVDTAQGWAGCLRRMQQRLRQECQECEGRCRGLIFHSDRADDARALARLIDQPLEIVELNPAVTVYTGRHVVGLAWMCG